MQERMRMTRRLLTFSIAGAVLANAILGTTVTAIGRSRLRPAFPSAHHEREEAAAVSDQETLWQPLDAKGQDPYAGDIFVVDPGEYREFALDLEALERVERKVRANAHVEGEPGETLLTLPMPDGSLSRFRVAESP